MSEFARTDLERWRALGLPKYLAVKMAVSEKTVSRWCDNGVVPDVYLTTKGHRRIRYTDDTVNLIRQALDVYKRTNRTIAATSVIKWCGREIDVNGCRTMRDVYAKAVALGFTLEDATQVAFRPRLGSERTPDPAKLWHDLSLTANSSLPEESTTRALPISWQEKKSLASADSKTRFQSLARQIWRNLLGRCEIDEEKFADFVSRHPGEGFEEVQQLLALSTPEQFRAALDALNPPGIPYGSTAVLRRMHSFAEKKTNAAFLRGEVVRIRLLGQTPTAERLAVAIGMSRQKLYRKYGAEMIRNAISPVWAKADDAETESDDQG